MPSKRKLSAQEIFWIYSSWPQWLPVSMLFKLDIWYLYILPQEVYSSELKRSALLNLKTIRQYGRFSNMLIACCAFLSLSFLSSWRSRPSGVNDFEAHCEVEVSSLDARFIARLMQAGYQKRFSSSSCVNPFTATGRIYTSPK